MIDIGQKARLKVRKGILSIKKEWSFQTEEMTIQNWKGINY